jgi:hypothetical protein
MGFAMERPLAEPDALAAVAEAAARFPCAKRGVQPRRCGLAFVVDLRFRPVGESESAGGAAPIAGCLCIYATDEHVADSASRILDDRERKQPHRRRRRGKH